MAGNGGVQRPGGSADGGYVSQGRVIGGIVLALGAFVGALVGLAFGALLATSICMHAGMDVERDDGTIDEGSPCHVAVPILLLVVPTLGGLAAGMLPGGLIMIASSNKRREHVRPA